MITKGSNFKEDDRVFASLGVITPLRCVPQDLAGELTVVIAGQQKVPTLKKTTGYLPL